MPRPNRRAQPGEFKNGFHPAFLERQRRDLPFAFSPRTPRSLPHADGCPDEVVVAPYLGPRRGREGTDLGLSCATLFYTRTAAARAAAEWILRD